MQKELRVNERIRAREVRLIGPDGQQLGIVPLREALQAAYERGLDLVEVAPHARPPVCRIMDYGKFKYEESKREREARKKQKQVTVKELKMRLTIEDHDLQVKLRSAERFLQDGDKVKFTIMFRGREIVHKDLGRALLDRIVQALAGLAQVERPPTLEGRNMVMVLAPRTTGSRAAPSAPAASAAEAVPVAASGEAPRSEEEG